MKNTSQKFLLSKTEIVFNKKKLLESLNSADDCNIVVITTSHFNVDNEIQISHQIAPMFIDKKTGTMTASTKANKKTNNNRMAASATINDGTTNGVQLPPCPYPPGCDTNSLIARAENVTSNLEV